jgi:hypothetical protein
VVPKAVWRDLKFSEAFRVTKHAHKYDGVVRLVSFIKGSKSREAEISLALADEQRSSTHLESYLGLYVVIHSCRWLTSACSSHHDFRANQHKIRSSL